jgi:hypothetical protein
MLFQQRGRAQNVLRVREGVPSRHRRYTQLRGRVADDLRAALVDQDCAGLDVPFPEAEVGALDDLEQAFAVVGQLT